MSPNYPLNVEAEILKTQAILVLRFEADLEQSLKEIRETVEAKVNEIIQ